MNSGRFPLTPPTIEPVPPGVDRPLWSVMIPAYNCIQTIEQTINSVLQQDPGEEKMQIEVIDDCSTEPGLEELIHKIGKGRVSYFLKEKNEGHVYTGTDCINRAKGHYVHILHSDDSVLPGYYNKIEELFQKFPEAGAAFTGFKLLHSLNSKTHLSTKLSEETVLIDNMIEVLAERLPMHYVTTVVKRSAYEQTGGFYATEYAEDWIMWARIASKFPFAYDPEILGLYSMHTAGSVSRKSFADGSFVHDFLRSREIISDLLPPGIAAQKDRLAQNEIANWLLAEVEDYWYETKDTKLAKMQISEIRKFYMDKKTLNYLRILSFLLSHPKLALLKKKIKMYRSKFWSPSIQS